MRQSKGLLAAAGATGADYITDGLALYYDAGDTSSYPGTGTTWTDLVSGVTATLNDGASYSSNYGGSIAFDGFNDNVRVSPSTSFTLSSATFMVWLRLADLSQRSFTGLFFGRGSSATGLNLFGTQEIVGYHWNNASSTYNFNSGLTIPSQEVCMVAASVQSSSATLYLCRSSGTTSSTNNVSHSTATFGGIAIGEDPSSYSRSLDGNIAIVQLYNRALSSTEVDTNFNAFKGRFGL